MATTFKIHVDEGSQVYEKKPKESKAIGKRCVLGQIQNNNFTDTFKHNALIAVKRDVLSKGSTLSTGFPENIKGFGTKDKEKVTVPQNITTVHTKSPLNDLKANLRVTDKKNELHSPMSMETSPIVKCNAKENVCNEIITTAVQSSEKNKTDISLASPMSVDASPTHSSQNQSLKSSFEDLYGCESYKEHIYKYLRKVEVEFRPKAYYMRRQPDVSYSMRTVLVDWLVEVGEEYKLKNETLFMSVSYIDRFLSTMAVTKPKLQLLGTTAMLIASKFEEIYPPEIREFTYITNDSYSVKQVLRMERMILKILSFDLSCPTAYTFIMHISSCVKLKSKIIYLAMYICELTLLEADPYLDFYPSLIACGAIALARRCLDNTDIWPCNLAQLTGYTFIQLGPVVNHLNETHHRSFTLPQAAIRQKYSVPEYEYVSQIPFKRLVVRDL